MTTYTVRTDGFMAEDIQAESLDDAINQAFDGEVAGVHDEQSLRAKFADIDGAWCWIEEDGVRVLTIGQCR